MPTQDSMNAKRAEDRFKVEVMLLYAVGADAARLRGLWQTAEYMKRRFILLADDLMAAGVID